VAQLDVDTPADKALQLHVSAHLVDVLAIHGIAHLAAPGTSGSTNSEMILPVPQETPGGALLAVDTVV